MKRFTRKRSEADKVKAKLDHHFARLQVSGTTTHHRKPRHSHDAEILEGIPRGVYADWWAQEQEEKGKSFSGQDITRAAPRTPGWAKKWGHEVADAIVTANHSSLEDLYAKVKAHGYPYDREHFGYHLGMETAGHGVSWSDDTKGLAHDAIKLPDREFYR